MSNTPPFFPDSGKPYFTEVKDTRTRGTTSQTYSLSPDVAVVAAYEQATGNYRWYDYPAPDDHPKFRRHGKIGGVPVVQCGTFYARI